MFFIGLIKFKVKITKKGYRVNPYNLFAFKSPTPAPLRGFPLPLWRGVNGKG
jgi:hypothetical protein